MSWSLDIKGRRRDVDDWGLVGLRLRYLSIGADELTFSLPAQFTDAELCGYLESASLYNPAGERIFFGRRVIVPSIASGRAEGQHYTFAGPWQWLGQNVYKQLWTGGIGGVLTQIYTSHLILRQSVGDIIKSVVQYAQANGAPLQIGTVNVPVVPPTSEILDRTCADVIMDALQYAPDAEVWFDYSVDPPALNCAQRPALDPVDYDLAATLGPRITHLDISPRPDMQVPSVELHYEITNEVDGETKSGFVRDVYPPGATGREDGALASTISLTGFSATHVQGFIKTAPIDLQSIAWWQSKFPWLKDARVQNLELLAGTAIRASNDDQPDKGFAMEIVEGQAAEWMTGSGGVPIDWQEIVASVQIKADLYEDATQVDTKRIRTLKSETLTLTVVTTNAVQGESQYETLDTFDAADPIPVGLAKYLYDAMAPLHYDARIQVVAEECSDIVRPGTLLNIQGGRPEWAAMAAVVQDCTLDIDTGTTSITAGPPKFLSMTSLLALLRANRTRRRWTNPSTQDSGSISAANGVELGKAAPNTNSIPGVSVSKFFAIKDGDNKISMNAAAGKLEVTDVGGSGRSMIIDLGSATWAQATIKAIEVVQVAVCVNGDNSYRMLVVGTRPWKGT